jgi:serine-type D-Ala-D-Ala endopeptidase (penicillin-binding protein 7)
MFAPAFLSIIFFALVLNLNLFTKEMVLFEKINPSDQAGQVKGITERPDEFVQSDHITETSSTENKFGTELADSIKKVIDNSQNMTINNTTDTIGLPDVNTAQAIKSKRENRLKNQPETFCQSAVILDSETGRYLYSKENDTVRSIASITKLMSALVFIDLEPDWNKLYEIQKDDKIEGGRIILFPGEKIKINDLFNLSLVGSDNMAIMALVHASGLGENEFVKKMNKKAAAFGMSKTNFVDPTGLRDGNVSTASELTALAEESFSNPKIIEALTKKDYRFATEDGRKKYIRNTDNLLRADIGGDIKIIGGKTGYNIAAGYCFVGKFMRNNVPVISVVLNAKSITARFSETEKIVKWAYNIND